jgi:hypothetical protein
MIAAAIASYPNMSMNQKRSAKPPPSRQLVDALMDRYVAWREESVAVDAAYASWRRAPSGDRAMLFAAYLAALDREERAADDYQRMIDQAAAA